MKLERGKSLRKKMIPLDTVRRFWKFVEIQPNGCWNWTGYCLRGYGYFWAANHHRLAHRVSLVMFREDIKYGKDVHHKCFNSYCVNPEHLEQVTRNEHVRVHVEVH
jgi:hypothetical protein